MMSAQYIVKYIFTKKSPPGGILSAAILLFALAGADVAAAVQVSLIVAPEGHGADGSSLLRQYDFADGTCVGEHTVATLDWTCSPFERPTFVRVADRWLVSGGADVVDLRTGGVTPRGGLAFMDTKLCGVDDAAVYVRVGNDAELHRFDLNTGTVTTLETPGGWGLPGVRSPSGIRSVDLRPPLGTQVFPPRDIWLYEVGAEPRLLGEGFGAAMSMFSSSFPKAPLFWLDDERLLTQRTTNMLVILHLDGTVEPCCHIPTSRPDSARTTFAGGDANGRFERSPDGGIVYATTYFDQSRLKLAEHRYLIDPETGCYEPYGLIWVPLGSGFERGESVGGDIPVTLRYRGRSIGSCTEFQARRALATDGYLAVAGNDTIKVWSAATDTWTALAVPEGERVDDEALLAWITP